VPASDGQKIPTDDINGFPTGFLLCENDPGRLAHGGRWQLHGGNGVMIGIQNWLAELTMCNFADLTSKKIFALWIFMLEY
jgi:hypothetical protein